MVVFECWGFIHMVIVMLRIISVFLFCLSLSSGVSSSEYKDALDAAAKGDFKTAIELFKPFAEKGDAAAQYNLGVIFFEGHASIKNYEKAAKWTRLAAEQGVAQAQFNYGTLFYFGYGIQQDDKQAARWYRLAAEQGVAQAQYNLGHMYSNGKGVSKDDKQAVIWYQLAAKQGFAQAQYNLGSMYFHGEGVHKDDVSAYMWWDLAIKNGDDYTIINNGNNAKDIVVNQMSSYQIKKAQRLSRECLKKEYKGCY